jgi:chorismate mutase
MLLKTLRDQIDAIDSELAVLLGKRIAIARQIARIKKQKNLSILDSNREDEIKTKVKKLAIEYGISPMIIEEIFQLLLDYSKMEMESQ